MLRSVEQILEAKIDAPKQRSGLYFLIKDNEIVYVGQSSAVAQRVAAHRGVMDHDSYTFLPCEGAEANDLEAAYIIALQPRYNTAVPSNSQWKSAHAVRSYFNFVSIHHVQKAARAHDVETVMFAGRVYYRIQDFPGFGLMGVSV